MLQRVTLAVVVLGVGMGTLPLGPASAWSSGNTAPTKTLAGASTGLQFPCSPVFDSSGNMYVGNQGNGVTVYGPGWATGDTAPIKTLGGENTGLSIPCGVALDGSGNMYVTNADAFASSVTVYGPGWATGDTAPIKTLKGANTGLDQPFGIAFDSGGNMYVTSSIADSVTVYGPGWAGGNTAPTKTLKGAGTGLDDPHGIAFDSAGNMYVANTAAAATSVTVYAAGWADGNTAPIKTLKGGTNTRLVSPYAIAIDSGGNMYVANVDAGSVTVYAAGWAAGDTAPIKTLQGANTGINYPFGVALDASNNLYVSSVDFGSGISSVSMYAGGSTPGTPTEVSAARQASQTVRVGFTAPSDGGSAITDYDVEYSTNPSFSAGSGTFFEGDTTTASYVDVTGLVNGTTYYFRVRASNAAGDGGWSAITNGAAPYATAGTPPGTPTGVWAARRASQTVQVRFTAPSDGGSAITDYDVEYSTSPSFAAGSGTFFEGGTTTASYVDVTGLVNGTTYYFRIRASNAAGDGGWSAITNGATPYATPGRPTGVSAARQASQTVRVSFTPPSDGGSAITDYDVEYSTSPSFSAGSGMFFEGGTTTASYVDVTGLTNGATYYFRVRATNAAGNSAWSTTTNGATPYAAPGTPTGVSAARQASQTVRLSFTAPSDGGLVITDYDVQYSTSATFASGVTFYEGGTTTTNFVDVSGLTNGTTYYFRVRASNAAGDGAWSLISNGAKPYITPGTPTGVSAARVASQTVRVSFTPPNDGGSAITDYDIQYSTNPTFASGVTLYEGGTTTTSFVDVNGLTNGTTYYFRVRATNAAGNGAWSLISNGAKPS